ncbi:MAG: hypothetical protein ACRDRH_21640 [Pseudonocardia sp.]
MGKTCVCGADELHVDATARRLTGPGGVTVAEGDMISIDGSTGEVFLGEVPVVASPVVEYFEGELDADADDLVRAVHRLMAHADSRRRLTVRGQCRHRRGRRPRPPVRQRGHRSLSHRAHVPRRPPPPCRTAGARRRRGRA